MAFALRDRDHTFKAGHRIMVQVQSTWFPVIDRNPQRYVPSIYEAAAVRFPCGDSEHLSLRQVSLARDSAGQQATGSPLPPSSASIADLQVDADGPRLSGDPAVDRRDVDRLRRVVRQDGHFIGQIVDEQGGRELVGGDTRPRSSPTSSRPDCCAHT